jgi:hypothetical protein
MTTFLWAWDNDPPAPDPKMTRARAARLLRTWRSRRRLLNRLMTLERIAQHSYKVTGPTGSATMTILEVRE